MGRWAEFVMNDTPPQKTYKPFGWLFSWRTLRRTLIALVGLATLVALFYSVENWRGKRAWEAYKQEQEAKGVRFDLAAFVPPEVPDEENFAMWPALEPLFHYAPETYGVAIDERLKNIGTLRGDWREGTRIDLALWLKSYERHRDPGRGEQPDPGPIDSLTRSEHAQWVLAAMKEKDPLLDVVRSGSRRPHARFNIHYGKEDPTTILLPHLSRLKSLCQLLAVRASAALALGRPGEAVRDVELIFYLADTIQDESFMISHMVRLACLNLGIQILWEGLAQQQWPEVQLRDWQSRFLEINLIAETVQSFKAERAFGNRVVESMANPGRGGEFEAPALNLLPRGWLYFEQLNYNCLFDERILPALDPDSRRIQPEIVRDNEAAMLNEYTGHPVRMLLQHRLFAGLLLPGMTKVHFQSAKLQIAIDQAALACALERYRLVHGSFPEKLDALSPAFLETIHHDLITGEPMIYRRESADSFVLYSVGWDGRDNGGTPVRPGREEGDWVWRYPPALADR
jgi:hypothetical protein